MTVEAWSAEAAQAARHFHERWREDSITAQAAVRNLISMGYVDAWNLWLDVCDEWAPEVGKRVRKQKNPDGGKRRSRPLPAREAVMSENEVVEERSEAEKSKRGRKPKSSNGANGATAAPEKKRGRQPKEPPQPIVMDLYLPRERTVQIGLPGDVSEEDMPILQEQLEAFMALRAAQRKARGG